MTKTYHIEFATLYIVFFIINEVACFVSEITELSQNRK